MEFDPGHIAWMLTASALVLFMMPGLMFFYGGMVRSKNMLNMLMMNGWCMGIVPIVWALVGFTIAFGEAGDDSLIGKMDFAGFADVGTVSAHSLAPAIPLIVFAAYQMTFAVITPALMSGSVADRMKFSAWAILVPVWLVVVYSPVAHWVFGGGWIAQLGALDFAGGAVVHINAGAGALALALILGKRKGWPSEPMLPHNVPWTMLGAGILWFGWFGFNAGSAVDSSGRSAEAFMNTFLAAAAAMVAWLIVERLKDGHPTTIGAASGIVAGLVAITPASGFVGGLAGIAIGAIAAVVCYFAIQLKYRFGYDDSLDVVGVHLVGGLVGALLTGLFADTPVGGADFGRDGLFFGGGWGLFGDQVVASLAVLVFSFVVTFVIAKVIDLTIGLRVSEDDESAGLDRTAHAETAYQLF